MNPKIFLDLDGIIRDFIRGVIDKFDLKITHDDINTWNFIEETDVIPSDIRSVFWGLLDHEFWASLPKTPFADEVLQIVAQYKPIILTSPTLTSAGGTQEWISKYLPEYFNEKRYLIGPAKWACANWNSILIDDAEHNINEFIKHGGRGILFPRPWNSLSCEDPIKWLKNS